MVSATTIQTQIDSCCCRFPLTDFLTHSEYSDQAAHAGSRLHTQEHLAMCPVGLPHGRTPGLLRLLSHHPLHDRSLHRHTIRRIRIALQGHEPRAGLRSVHPLHRRWSGRCLCGRYHHTFGRGQDAPADPRPGGKRGGPVGQGIDQRRGDHQAAVRLGRVLAWCSTSDYLYDAEYGYLLVGLFLVIVYAVYDFMLISSQDVVRNGQGVFQASGRQLDRGGFAPPREPDAR